MKIRIGQGIDFHRLETGLELWLGGILIPSEKGCVAHSDGDVLIHAICDGLLGAAGLRDIGYYFPDSSDDFKDIDSKILLERTFSLIRKNRYNIINLDCTVCLENPRISPFIPEMKETIAALLSTDPENVAIKATTTEKLGFTGREEGIMALAVVLISQT
ncbi:MAG: 2-C-methyl-D-erythritol 2,4-cyclodiphosphate synthase [Bacteroidetes bacterium GWE2_41_25]|nr:MAG: 2-C-methyl-D-erythritol 2,4-cyclodiphosphate synthase [Bacteroidetes bacterium GWA2_40_15]OFX89747.1 MAG: 2-C-methyl-D-erythritol 2,4-cyclodiphosphate synthase [Bacteroidetes bacterium GWC2_40_22]OFY00625.1 MAG: 2-C-methyl-D-erythritol 2,4-cyclodiphosphate synthase [Bacteroidetes bacterium GWE2_41_25]OFY57920.1 MAG: 2-C-methyl-D-erythritol 2,4-cyclodiphosphate synthase [Bacteroidetes bacterium GWF2_41_9]HAM09098.1 2-C-methyl-D-erythritol 2,4-cyclodiphosphate synthase [Bacteroidales bact